MSVQSDQAVSTLRRAVQEVLSRGLHDPRVRGLVSVTRVDLSTDQGNATVHVSVLPAEHGELTLHGIRHATSYIRSETAKRVAFRRMPALSFRLDNAIKREAEVLGTLSRLEDERAERGPEIEQPPSEGGATS